MRRSKKSPEPEARGNFTPPPRGAATAPVPGSEPRTAPAKSGGRLSPRNWRVPTRLNAILLIPVVVGLVMGGFQVKGSIDTWQEAQDAENTAKLVRSALTYSNALLVERDVTAAPLLQGKGENDPTVVAARKATDKASDEFDAAAQNMPKRPNLVRRLDGFRKVEPQLQTIRAVAYTSKLTGVKTEEGYVEVEHKLLEFSNELGLGTGNITSYGRTVYALALGQGALSLQRAIGMHLLIKPGTSQTSLSQQRVALTSYAYLENIATQEYQSGGTEQDIAKLTAAQKQIQADAATMIQEQKAKNPDYVAPPTDPVQFLTAIASIQSTDASERAALAEQGVTAENWWAMTTLKFDAYRKIESGLSDTAVNEASDIASNAQRDAYITGAAVVVALLLAFILASAVARQMSRSMRQLRNAAFGIAEQRLPMLVDQLSRTDPGRVDTRVAPIPINTTDEIGEVARAFDQVHREAVRLAAEQALLRGNINAIFTNLSRRNQSLIEGQLTLITDLENNEADPDQLENLFRLDHLATRMRRNGENLLVLAGEEPGRRWDQPVPLVDVLRAASSEVEQYERVELSGVPEAEIHGRAVTDLVHLLAELLENATTFSSPQTKVRVTATRLPDGRVMIEIHDKGIGLTAEDFADINHKLANPPTVDAAISQRMGLFVVGRLSDRHGIRVQLRPSGEQAGTTSLVMLPDAITHGGGGEHQPEQDQFTVSQIIPEQQFGKPGGESFGQMPQQQPMRTAAELGFDDTQYEVPDDIRDLDPVGRSLMREERRAALDAPQPEAPFGQQNAHPQNQPQNTRETPLYGDSFTDSPHLPQQAPQLPYESPQNGFDGAATGFVEQPQAPQSPYGTQSPYEGAQQQSYDEPYFTPQASPNGGGGYPEPGAQDNGAGASNGYPSFEQPSYQDDWPQQGDYRNGYPDQYAPEAESAQVADAAEAEPVGFERPGPAPSAARSLTDAGLPRRGGAANGNGMPGGVDGGGGNGGARQETPAPATASDNGDDGSWRSANDERWQQASQLRKPKAGGVTSSGLPRRVPKANLVEGAAESTQQGGPQISRAPEDIRGRLSNLRRGVQRGRTAGSETNGQATWNEHSGSDSTYNQER
ncbi:nitrate- and nitrite sensing domain-containing protein [Streptomyces acidiscabies]|uniref:nitrate- and nitrite sensing domain-containing protein n=1 Tax=Streptomyces acidiscabies TaxID=42234 RepID=UPI00099DE221|nr:nitrate- and nitrite sensing domain-containing protein [Streptomyces acidiscabies]